MTYVGNHNMLNACVRYNQTSRTTAVAVQHSGLLS